MFVAFVGGAWVPCEFVKAKGAKVEVVVHGVHWVMFAGNVNVAQAVKEVAA